MVLVSYRSSFGYGLVGGCVAKAGHRCGSGTAWLAVAAAAVMTVVAAAVVVVVAAAVVVVTLKWL